MAWKKPDEHSSYPEPAPAPRPPAPPLGEPRRAERATATIGPSIFIQGDLSGDEDLVIEGRVEGKIDLKQHNVTIGRNGRVRADVFGTTVVVEGEVDGNLFAQEQAVVRQSGAVRGNITAPRVMLEDGSRFRGSIDMESSKDAAAAEHRTNEEAWQAHRQSIISALANQTVISPSRLAHEPAETDPDPPPEPDPNNVPRRIRKGRAASGVGVESQIRNSSMSTPSAIHQLALMGRPESLGATTEAAAITTAAM